MKRSGVSRHYYRTLLCSHFVQAQLFTFEMISGVSLFANPSDKILYFRRSF